MRLDVGEEGGRAQSEDIGVEEYVDASFVYWMALK